MFVNKHFANFTGYNSRILRNKSATFSGYSFCMNTNILGNFQICISVPLISNNQGKKAKGRISKQVTRKQSTPNFPTNEHFLPLIRTRTF